MAFPVALPSFLLVRTGFLHLFLGLGGVGRFPALSLAVPSDSESAAWDSAELSYSSKSASASLQALRFIGWMVILAMEWPGFVSLGSARRGLW